jgi:hypothetical protein
MLLPTLLTLTFFISTLSFSPITLQKSFAVRKLTSTPSSRPTFHPPRLSDAVSSTPSKRVELRATGGIDINYVLGGLVALGGLGAGEMTRQRGTKNLHLGHLPPRAGGGGGEFEIVGRS